jgi:enoyl-CoA hydratase/carnithine racemase
MLDTPAQIRPIDVADADDIAVITLNRPRKRNALTREIREELTDQIERLTATETTRAIVLTSRESGFSAGQDLLEAKDFTIDHIPDWIHEHMNLYRTLLSYPRPLVAAVDGCCVGAGLQLALLCDLRVASSDAYFAMPEIDDAIPCILGIWTLWDLIGRGRTTEMVLTNRKVPADEAQEWGLVSKTVPGEILLDSAFALARSLASKPALAYRLTKERLRLLSLEGSDALTVHAQYAHQVAFASGEPAIAMSEFLAGQRKT